MFFGGRDFAPNFIIEGLNIQDYLQNHYCNAMSKVASVLVGETNVIGFDTLNEPNNGYIGLPDLNDAHTIVSHRKVVLLYIVLHDLTSVIFLAPCFLLLLR